MPSHVFVEAIANAHRLHRQLDQSMDGKVTAADPCAESHVKKPVPFGFLSPHIIRSILNGSIASRLTIDDLVSAVRQLDWQLQIKGLGVAPAV